jgi:hypothetical protein
LLPAAYMLRREAGKRRARCSRKRDEIRLNQCSATPNRPPTLPVSGQGARSGTSFIRSSEPASWIA